MRIRVVVMTNDEFNALFVAKGQLAIELGVYPSLIGKMIHNGELPQPMQLTGSQSQIWARRDVVECMRTHLENESTEKYVERCGKLGIAPILE